MRNSLLRSEKSIRGVVEDGPYGGSGGSPWTDGGEGHTNGEITEIELHHGSEIGALVKINKLGLAARDSVSEV